MSDSLSCNRPRRVCALRGPPFETSLDALIAQRDVMRVVDREQVDLPSLDSYLARFSAFLQAAQAQGIVRQELDTEMITGALLDRLLNQILFAPWLQRTFGVEPATDGACRERWCRANVDLFLFGMVGQEPGPPATA